MKQLFPLAQPFIDDHLRVSELHHIHFEVVGNPKGQPAVFLHGGPGAGINPFYRRYFNPKKWKLVLFDQRGCGKSTPYTELNENTTWDLVEDIEKLRQHLGIQQWVVFGGSWGSSLALAYAQRYPERCKGLILRGIFLVRQQEIDWLYQQGANRFFPEAWQKFLAPIPLEEQGNLVQAYQKRLHGDDPKQQLEAARAWSQWEASASRLIPDPALIAAFGYDRFALAFAQIECHYFVNQSFLQNENQLLQQAHRLQNIPGVIVHGRYDMVCPVISAWQLHQAWPQSKLHIIPDAGHSISEPGIQTALLQATEDFALL